MVKPEKFDQLHLVYHFTSDIADDVLEQSVCQALSLTGTSVEPDNLQACHRMRRKDHIIIKFKCRKQKHPVLLNCKTL